jgi:hypothetical protein
MVPNELRLSYDAEEGFTVIGKPEDEAFIQQVKSTLTEKQGKNSEHIKRALIAQDPEEPKVYCIVVQHESKYKQVVHDDE